MTGAIETARETAVSKYDGTVDLKAVLARVKTLFKENEELAGLLVGETSNGAALESPWVQMLGGKLELVHGLVVS